MSELPRLEIPWTEDDVLPELAGCIEGFDLTGYVVRLNVARPTTALEKDASIDDPSSGAFSFAWADDDLVEGLGQEALLRLVDEATDETLTLLRFVVDVGKVPA